MSDYTVKVDDPWLTAGEAVDIRRRVHEALKSGVFVHGPHISVRKL